MKAKILTLFIISLIAFNSKAQTTEERKLAEERNMEMLEKMGLPAFNSGIKIVPRAMLGIQEKVIKKGAEEEKQRKTLGYAKKSTSRPIELLTLRKNAPIYLKTYAKILTIKVRILGKMSKI